MSWHYLQEPAGGSSAACCSGGEPLPQLRSKTTHAEFYCNGNLMESYLDSLSGTTCQHSTANHGAEKSMSLAGDFLARIFPAPGKVKALQEHEAAYGVKWRESFAKWDRDTSSWKTHQCLLLGGWESFSETWPKWGMMRAGVCSERVMPARPTSGIESGSGQNFATPTAAANQLAPSMAKHPSCVMWQTPVSDDSANRVAGKVNSRGEPKLSAQVKMWPTPRKRDYKGSNAPEGLTRQDGKSRMDQLPNAVEYLGGTKTPQTWATPTRSDYRSPNMNPSKSGQAVEPSSGHALPAQAGGQLNPNWVEWLMGWPIGWTDLKPLETGRFQA